MAPPSKKPSNLVVRIASALVLIPIVVVAAYFGHPWFDALVILFAAIMAWEWARIAGRRRNPFDPSPAARLPVESWTGQTTFLVGVVVMTLMLLRPPLVPGLPGISLTEMAQWEGHFGALFLAVWFVSMTVAATATWDDARAVFVGDLLDDRQAQAGALALGGDVRLEGPLEHLVREAVAVVEHLHDQAIALVARERKCSTSFIQRYLQIGYNRAARIVERMEREGVVSSANHVGKREVLARDIDDRER